MDVRVQTFISRSFFSCAFQAVIKQFSGSGYESSNVMVIDEVELYRHQQLEKLYKSTRAKLSEDCYKYGGENYASEGTLAKAATLYGGALVNLEKEYEEYNRILVTQILEPLRSMATGASLEDARHLAQRYSRMRQDAEVQAAEISRRHSRVRETPILEHTAKLQTSESKMQDLKANMAVLGKEAAAALAAVESQQQRLTFQRIFALMLSEKQRKESAIPSAPQSMVHAAPNRSENALYFLAEVDPSGWSEGECNGRAGWFPSAYVERRQNIPPHGELSHAFSSKKKKDQLHSFLRAFYLDVRQSAMAVTRETIGVIGGGQMGSGIAQLAAVAGFDVWLHDSDPGALRRASEGITAALRRLVSKGQLSQPAVSDVLNRLRCTSNLEDLKHSDVIIEAIVESEDVKKKLFSELDKLAKPNAILASNTSSISITRLASATSRPSQVIGMHFMNPPPVMKLVEIVRGADTSDEVFSKIKALAERFGKIIICSQDFPGFIVNRILMPMINEAFYALYSGVATKEDIDTGMKLGTNHPMGPLELADFIGLDICLSIMKVLHQGLGDSKYNPCPLLIQYVDAGRLGRKRGIGVYVYQKEPAKAKPLPSL
ncbi:Peroxisomal fatty acid beta-oxidation multifunctional protein [Apostasia shenzhenica]|uniref:Peroxisomal fatty acid beta-oxidation multifunctional protein n=1 Tax=Apostasia shenzhenica TaxID=1088818 RepID=A0A2I0AAL1_9ASPA|nr:Peroxisomal fatty acid beta-oxidation multifunctional protein [Apostasia shenzhenica]